MLQHIAMECSTAFKNGLKLHVTKCYKYTTKPTQTKRCRRQCIFCARQLKKLGNTMYLFIYKILYFMHIYKYIICIHTCILQKLSICIYLKKNMHGHNKHQLPKGGDELWGKRERSGSKRVCRGAGWSL